MVRKLYDDSLDHEQRKKETEDERSEAGHRPAEQLRMRHSRRLPLQSLRVQEL